MKKIVFLLLIVLFSAQTSIFAQQNVGISDIAITPDASSMLEVRSTTKGMLIPRVALVQTTSVSPVTSPATSLLVYNTASVNDVTPGFYYWSGSAWVRLLSGTVPTSGWALTGNAGTAPATNFLGTTDAQDFVVRTNNTERIRVLSGGNVGIGTTTPAAQLHTTGTVRFANYPSGANGAIVRTNVNGDLSITNFSGNATDVLLGNGTFGPAPAGAAGWLLTGNTLAGTEFIGSVNGQPFIIRTQNVERMRILANGNIGIGNPAPLCYLYFNKPTTLNDFHTQWDNTLAGDAIARFQNTNATNGNRVLFGVTNYNASAFQASAVIGLHLNTAGEGGTGVEGFSNSDDAVGVYAGFTGGTDPSAIGWALLSNGWAGGTTAWQNLSDSRIKKDIKPIENPLAIIKQIKGVEYYYDNSLYPDLNLDTESKQIGFIAQDIEAVLPYLVREANIRGTNGEYSPSMNQKLSVYKLKTFSYSDIVPILLEGMKEQQTIIESLEHKIESFEQRIETLEKLLLEMQ